ncbi:MAG: type 4a pilus biogenesis protein PilO [Patescibacteria group bacterium]
MKGIIPIICIVIAGGLFYWYIDPTYAEVRELRAEEATLNQALDRALELQETRDQLLSRYNTFAQLDLERLEKLLPDHVDNVRLVLDLDGIAVKYGMRVRNVTIEDPNKNKKPTDVVGPAESRYESMVISFSVTGNYDTFRQFMLDLERSLRIVDLESLTFSAAENDLYDFSVSLRTYWLTP